MVSISKSWFRVRDAYRIEVVPETIDPMVVVAMIAAIDMSQGPG